MRYRMQLKHRDSFGVPQPMQRALALRLKPKDNLIALIKATYKRIERLAPSIPLALT